MAAQTNGVHKVIPSDNRVESGSVNIEPASYPPTIPSTEVNCVDVATELVSVFNRSLKSKDYESLANLFVQDGYWRDHLCQSWDLHTFKGRTKILKAFTSGCHLERVELDTSAPHRAPCISNVDVPGTVHCVLFFVTVTTQTSHGQGIVRATQEQGQWKILALFTSLRGLKDYPEGTGEARPLGVQHGEHQESKNWQEKRVETVEEIDPVVLVIGAGQGGLTTAARLGMLGVQTLMIDRNARVGDNWRQRYHRLVLHDPVWFNHMPYLPFPGHWPVFTPKDKLADFFEAYVSLLELNVWTRTTMQSATWDEQQRRWTVQLEREVGGVKEVRTLHPRHIIQATGHSGKKNMPTLDGLHSFRGRICHSSEFPGATPGSTGKRAVVIGSCNSAHDIAQDFYENGYDVTIVQRSSTCVVSSKSIVDFGLKGLFREDGPPVDDADLLMWSMPSELAKSQQIQLATLMREADKDLLDGLQKVGFKLDSGPHEAGLFYKYFQRGGGYYIDVGASQLIMDGKIKVKQGTEVAEVLPDGILFADGSKLEADEVVLATGYQNMRTQARELFGDGLADQIRDVWGMTEEGEFRTMWQRSGHPGFWFMGGNLALTRYHSRLLALQIKASLAGLVA
ncbi:FAD/NAD(P)-binding domain-containing protein [Thozetella sp. PMI_491]|nr:FAD/NAD(P)-binding domain-containing protein [Thozetella sp. PMI_491]